MATESETISLIFDHTIGRLAAVAFAIRTIMSLSSVQDQELYNQKLDKIMESNNKLIEENDSMKRMWEEFQKQLAQLKVES
ncbi:MAG: hypothetical protein OXC18_05560 [Desulfurellaceae bacterium]|nr:hypothetical protein [Desulfurellaceae bacterium]